MTLSEQCCTLEQAKRLKELGVNQYDATFYFYEEIVNGKRSFPIKPLVIISDSCSDEENESIVQSLEGKYKNEVYAAFTVAELGEMLPFDMPDGANYAWYHRYCWRGHSVGYSQVGGNKHLEAGWHPTEAAARADLLINLLEMERLIPENLEANKRKNS